jgi:hypothetical protein
MSGEDAPRPYLENLIVLEIKTNKAVGCGRRDECIQDMGVSGAVAVGCGRRDVRAVYSMEGD